MSLTPPNALLSWPEVTASLPTSLPGIEELLDRTPLTLPAETRVCDAIAQMSQVTQHCAPHCNLHCALETSPSAFSAAPRSSCYVLVLEGARPVGILTERDVVRLSIAGIDLTQVTLAEVMNQPLVSLTLSSSQALYSALALFHHHQIRHLPIVNEQGQLQGVVTRDRLCHILQPVNLLKLRQVAELMTEQVIHATATDSVLQVAQQMVRDRKSCVVVVEPSATQPEDLLPIGILTERDMVQFQHMGVHFAETAANAVMSAPLFCLKPTDSLWQALQDMQERHVRRLVVTGDRGELRGILTQTSLLRAFDPVEMAGVIEVMQQQLEQQTQTLNQTVEQLKREMLDRQQANLALQESQQRLQTIFNQTFQFIGVLRPDGILIDVNRVALEFIGVQLPEVMGQPFWETPWWTHDPAQQAQLQVAINQAASGQFARHEFTHRRFDGTLATFDFSIKPVWSESGQVISLVAEGRNIDDRKLMEQQLQTALQKQAKIALQQSEAKFRHFAENSQKVIWIAQLNSLDNLYVSPAYEQVWGRSTQSLIDRPDSWLESVHPEDRDRVRIKLEQQRQGASSDLEYRIIRPDGSTRWIWDRGFAIHNETGEVYSFGGIAEDITERKRLETEREHLLAQAEASRQQVVTILESITDGFIALDHDWRFTYVNAQAGHILQRNPADLLGKQVWSEFVDVAETAFYREYHRAIAKQVTVEFEEFYAPLNTWFAVHAYPSTDGLVAYFQDITQRKQAEEKIREQAMLIDVASDAIYVRDLANRIIFWNQGAEKLYGWPREEALNKNATDLLFTAQLPQLSQVLNTVFEQGVWQGELQKVTKSGNSVTVMSRLTLVQDADGTPRSILSVDTDMTEKKQLESQFLRAQRLESIGTLASGIAHDLNNILTPILAAAQLLPHKLPPVDASSQRLLEILEINARRGGDLVKQVLSFARGEEGQRIPLQVGHLLAEIGKIAQQTFPKSIRVQIQVPTSNLWLVQADATQLHQVIMNLCVNARDAMPQGGTLTIAAENCTLDETFVRMHLDAQVGCYLKMTIADTGSGIAPEVLDRIFDPFFTTKEQSKGTGLGLSTVLTIVKRHGGFVDVVTQVGKGTSFQVYLPTIQQGEERSVAALEYLEGNDELILVVDDETAIRQTVQEILESHHYRVLVAEDGIEAIALYAQHQSEIALVLLDLAMPSLDGFKVIETLSRFTPPVPMIAMSGLTSLQERVDASGRVQAFLAKPFTAQDLLSTVGHVLERSSLAKPSVHPRRE
ncbi:MAG: PAS domain S-box protein [Oculatellaceae cyanobacterium Prado106]|jgi:hypothetical protein|nr:PAS domain S-box protein [Oculatellaceae cyanobacterium Prado106]